MKNQGHKIISEIWGLFFGSGKPDETIIKITFTQVRQIIFLAEFGQIVDVAAEER